jgi:halocyanin-like protein
MKGRTSRRRFVRGVGVVAAVGALAGCSGDGGESGGSDGNGGGGDGDSGESTPVETPTAAATATDGSGRAEIDAYLSNADNYGGTIADRTGRGEVAVEVGATGNGGGFAFGPAAIRVDPGTTVVWEWIGQGGLHNVVAEDGTFDSGESVAGAEETFEYTFDGAGTYLYFCTPHKALGMKGAVEVA